MGEIGYGRVRQVLVRWGSVGYDQAWYGAAGLDRNDKFRCGKVWLGWHYGVVRPGEVGCDSVARQNQLKFEVDLLEVSDADEEVGGVSQSSIRIGDEDALLRHEV